MSENWYGPRIKQIGNYLNDQYASGAFPLGIVNLEGLAVASPAQTPLLADRDPVLQEICVGMSGVETQVKTVNGVPPLLITDAIDCRAFNCAVSYEPQQDLHGYDSPWPAGGGTNKLDTHTSIEITQTNNGVTFKLKDDIFTVSNEVTSSYPGVTLASMGLPNLVLPAGTYRLYAFDDTSNYGARLVTPDYSKYLQRNSDITLTEETIFTKLVSGTSMTGETASGSFKIMVVDTSSGTPTAWTPYSNICPITGWTGCEVYAEESYDPSATSKASVSFDHTVYGGTAEIVAGTGDENVGGITFSGNVSEGWQLYALWSGTNTTCFYANNINNVAYTSNNDKPVTNCNWLPSRSRDELRYNDAIGIGFSGTVGREAFPTIRVPNSIATTTEALLAHLAQNPLHVVFKLTESTPFTFQGAPLDLAKGDNYIWSDTNGNDISVTYVAEK